MSWKERRRLVVCSRVAEGALGLATSAEILDLSYRQMRRIYARWRAEGDAGLVHKGRGKPSGRSYGQEMKQAVLARYEERYGDFGPTLAAEKLAADGFMLDHETLRRWLIVAGLMKVRRSRAAHRSMRERKHHFGELVQLDGSHHEWFEKRAPACCLMQMIDDATGVRVCLLAEQETTADAMRVLSLWIEHHGVPQALYTDRKTVYISDRKPTLEEELAGDEPLSEFGVSCAHLGIRIIAARSPQAKGRVERAHGVLQDRLVKELRLLGISNIAQANELLVGGFIDELSDRLKKAPAAPEDRHRPLGQDEDLAAMLSLRKCRTLTNDFTVRHRGRVLQVLKQPGLPRPGTRIEVQERLDGSIHLVVEGRDLDHEDITERLRQEKVAPIEPAPKLGSVVRTPPRTHPWRKAWSPRQVERDRLIARGHS